MAVRDPTSSLFPEVVAIEFDKVLFSTSTNVIVVVAYISGSELPAAKSANRRYTSHDAIGGSFGAFVHFSYGRPSSLIV